MNNLVYGNQDPQKLAAGVEEVVRKDTGSSTPLTYRIVDAAGGSATVGSVLVDVGRALGGGEVTPLLVMELDIRLAPGAAKELARRVGGFVREGDVDRQRQGALAVAELEKLSLYRPFDPVSEDDVRALVSEVVPDSTWAFLDAVADRKVVVAAPLLDRLLESTPEPVLLVQLHRRIRELIEVADHLAAGAAPGSLVRTLGMKPFRVDKLVGQARRWRPDELDDALEGLLDLDAAVKGAPDAGRSDAQRRLAFSLWMRERVAPAG